ncbi:ABC transporter permease [Clostridium saccharobutylicum]|uniref:Ribose transport system permease protein RbsC n=2 Tax=Clostridium saccharobutylicum TaxID=169679 RepID=U5MP69_CLOSA|nr:ribose ABC transporter permease [Clostridium saccharobutylicum]AGX42589.1 ribose transport system permease protein RbsC [Clostridium saccharobutylicum DSM 13864]AQR89875.1 ribose transport system permease protein RbsC [Clostridium saccharobutylicum]AQR99779.1 ribose transport system permease protein RbsC [Clostridium saccharobutylicum]AQS09507.1 ribose transport system permease protein RbsC [Clostridium saccharobutylicum]AQS13763.1 ribose transport system permease protein RbsC [Clostridium 
MNENVKSNLKKYRSLIGLFLLCVIIAIATPRFLTLSNITNVLTQIAVNAIIAVGMSFVILTGGIDLSVGSTVALSGAVAASVVLSTGSIPLAIIAAIIVGAVIGLINGVLVSKGKLQAFIATLATMTIFRGETLVFTQGNPISKLPESFMVLGNGSLGFLPVPILITIIVAVIAIYALSQTKLGRYIYAVGGNEDSSRLSGINTNKIKTLVYMVAGIASAIGGIILTSRIGSASPNAGTGYELDAIAAVVIGGTSLSGGEGKISGTIIGALIIGVISNGLNLMNVSPFYQSIVKGLVILIAVLLDKKQKNN